MASIFRSLMRKKILDLDQIENTKLSRCLSTVDLTLLGIGSTLGVGIYVLAGQVALNASGPAVTVSFLVAALASVFAGLCYAEFGARVPRAGSAYVYSYVSVGELMAFVIGWNLILEYAIGTASVAKAYSNYLDSMVHDKMSAAFQSIVYIDVPYIGHYLDFFAFTITMAVTIILAVGVKESSNFNNIFTVLNLLVVLYVVICGCFKADIANWEVPESKVHDLCTQSCDPQPNCGTGGFLPFGFMGMMSGAATCFFGFVGFDVVATTGEEAKNPQRAIPLSIIFSLAVIFMAYFGVAAVITLMVPYCLQDEKASLPKAFEFVGWPVAQWIVTVGALFGLSTSLLGSIFPLPRVIYAMACDGLVFRSLANVHPKSQMPLLATFISGFISALLAAVFALKELVAMMSIGTLLAYTLVAASVLLLRFEDESHSVTSSEGYKLVPQEVNLFDADVDEDETNINSSALTVKESTSLIGSQQPTPHNNVLLQIFNLRGPSRPTSQTSSMASWQVLAFCVLSTFVAVTIIQAGELVLDGIPWAIALLSVGLLLLVLTLIGLALQPRSPKKPAFLVPWVPLIPALSIFVNIFLMLMLSTDTWIRFGVWMCLGFLVYTCYALPTRYMMEKKQKVELQTPAVTDNSVMNGHVNHSIQADDGLMPEIAIQQATPVPSAATTPVMEKEQEKTFETSVRIVFHNVDNEYDSIDEAEQDRQSMEAVEDLEYVIEKLSEGSLILDNNDSAQDSQDDGAEIVTNGQEEDNDLVPDVALTEADDNNNEVIATNELIQDEVSAVENAALCSETSSISEHTALGSSDNPVKSDDNEVTSINDVTEDKHQGNTYVEASSEIGSVEDDSSNNLADMDKNSTISANADDSQGDNNPVILNDPEPPLDDSELQVDNTNETKQNSDVISDNNESSETPQELPVVKTEESSHSSFAEILSKMENLHFGQNSPFVSKAPSEATSATADEQDLNQSVHDDSISPPPSEIPTPPPFPPTFNIPLSPSATKKTVPRVRKASVVQRELKGQLIDELKSILQSGKGSSENGGDDDGGDGEEKPPIRKVRSSGNLTSLDDNEFAAARQNLKARGVNKPEGNNRVPRKNNKPAPSQEKEFVIDKDLLSPYQKPRVESNSGSSGPSSSKRGNGVRRSANISAMMTKFQADV